MNTNKYKNSYIKTEIDNPGQQRALNTKYLNATGLSLTLEYKIDLEIDFS